MFKPQLVTSLKQYNGKTFVSDLIAGIIVGIVALPLAIAFAIASGVGPAAGIFTAIIAGFCISAFGGSTTQIGGPTGAFTVIIYGIVNSDKLAASGISGMVGLSVAAMIAGVLLILMGVFKMGGLVKFIPYTIVAGFTAGIAVTIAAGQIGEFFGLRMNISEANPMTIMGDTYTKMPGKFLPKVIAFGKSMGTINFTSLIMAAVCLAFLFVWPKLNKKIPGSIIVIIVATVANILINKFAGLQTAEEVKNLLPGETMDSFRQAPTIFDTYGQIPNRFSKPEFFGYFQEHVHSAKDFFKTLGNTIPAVFPSAISIAVLAAIESLLSAVVADGMTGDKHNSNQELIGQGIANVVTPIFGGIPATGAIARTATNIKNGGKTPVAGIFHALTLLVIMLFLGKYVGYIPMAALAAVLINVAWNMAGIPTIRKLLKGQKSDVAVLAVTFLITVFMDLTVAIGVGLAFAAFFFIKKMIDVSSVRDKRENITGGLDTKSHPNTDEPEEKLNLPDGASVYEIDGPLFFGTVRKFEVAMERTGLVGLEYKVLILRMRKMIYLDAGGIQALEQAKAACDRKGVTIVISGIHTQPYMLLEKSGMADKLGRENICENIDLALNRANEILGNPSAVVKDAE